MPSDESESDISDEMVDVFYSKSIEDGSLHMEAGPLYVEFAEGESGGVRIIQEGPLMVLQQGIDYDDGDVTTVGHKLEVDEVRELAAALEEAADNAEEAKRNPYLETEEEPSLLERAMRSVLP